MKIRLNRNHCLLVLAGLAGVVVGRSGWRKDAEHVAQPAKAEAVSVKRVPAPMVTAAGRMESRPVIPEEAFDSTSGDSVAVIEPVRAAHGALQGSSNFGVNGTFSASVPGRRSAPSRDELAARAAQVEVEASHELKRLVGLLNLNDTQQDKIFEILAVNSPSWHPALAVTGGLKSEVAAAKPSTVSAAAEVGSGAAAAAAAGSAATPSSTASPAVGGAPEAAAAPPSVSDQILAELEIDQALAYESEESDRISWWEEILTQVMPETVVSDGTGFSVAAAISLTEPTLTVAASPLAPVPESPAETTPVETAPVASSEISTPKKSVTRPTTLPSE